jgi:hypothetical protein
VFETGEITGTYESMRQDDIWRIALLENGALETHLNGEKHGEYLWKIEGEEIHVEAEASRGRIYRINDDGSLTSIAYLDEGKRIDRPKDKPAIYKRIT